MTTPTGTISMTDIQTEFGGVNPISLSEYYAGGSYVPATTAGVPSSGAISMDSLRGKTKAAATAPTYSVTSDVTSVNEGDYVTFTVTTQNTLNRQFYFSLDAVSGTFVAGDMQVNANAAPVSTNGSVGTVRLQIKADALTEGVETFIFNLRLNSTTGTIIASSALVTVNDTSKASSGSTTPAPPSAPGYAVSTPSTSVNEGGAILFTITLTNLPDTTLYYTLDAVRGAFDSSDLGLASNSISGSVRISNGTGTVGVQLSSDAITEGLESFKLNLRTGSTTGAIVASSSEITISEATPTYSLSFGSSAISEGQSTTWTLTTSNVAAGTTLYFYNEGTSGATWQDVVNESQWKAVVTAGNVTTGTITAAYDSAVDGGAEKFTWLVFQAQNSGNTVLATGSFYIYDRLGDIGVLELTREGGGQYQPSSLYLQITQIEAYPAARTFNLTYVVNGEPETNASLVTTTITVPANATSSSRVLVFYRAAANLLASVFFYARWPNAYNGKQSNQLSSVWI